MNRRDLLRTLSAATAGTALGGCSTGPGLGPAPDPARPDTPWSALFIPGYTPAGVIPENEPTDSRRRRARAEQGTLLTRLAPDGSLRQAAFPVIGHDVAISPDGSVGFFGRMGYRGQGNTAHHVAFDPETLEMIAIGQSPGAEWRGGGHGTFLPDGMLLTTERAPMRPYSGDPGAHGGRIAFRDPRTLAVLDTIPSHGIDPHELRLTADGGHVAVAHYGSVAAEGHDRLSAPRRVVDACITVVHLASGALIAKYRSTAPEVELRHLAIGPEGRMFGIRARLAPGGTDTALQRALGETEADITAEGNTAFLGAAPVLVGETGATSGRVLAWELPDADLRHGLSVEYDPVHRAFLATFPSSHRVIAFDAETGRVRRSVDTRRHGLRYPCGLALLPGRDLYAVAGHWDGILIMHRDTHRPDRTLDLQPVLRGHSHMTAV